MGYNSRRHLREVSGLVATVLAAVLAGEDLPDIPQEEHLRTRRAAAAAATPQPSLKLAI